MVREGADARTGQGASTASESEEPRPRISRRNGADISDLQL